MYKSKREKKGKKRKNVNIKKRHVQTIKSNDIKRCVGAINEYEKKHKRQKRKKKTKNTIQFQRRD